MKKDGHRFTEDVLLDYLDGVLDAEAETALREELQRNAELCRALEALQAEQQALFDLGRELRVAVPSIHAVDSVMETLNDTVIAASPLENELVQLGDALKAAQPMVDLAGNISTLLPGVKSGENNTSLEQELATVGELLRVQTPRVNLVSKVMAGVRKESSTQPTSLSEYAMRKSAARRNASLSWRLIAAVAAGLVVGIGLFLVVMVQPARVRRMEVARNAQSRPALTVEERPENPAPPLREGEAFSFSGAGSGELEQLSAMARPASREGVVPAYEEEAPAESGFTVQDILRAKQKALAGQADALAMLARWGALDPDEVRRLFAGGYLTAAQIAGMSRFLPDGEAADLLRAAVKQTPDDPALRFALASQLMGDPAGYEEALQHLAALREVSPENALVHYMDAQLRFAMGDYSGALAGLESAAALETGNAYGLANAQYHSAALQAAGLAVELADTVAAFYAGTDEYGAISQMKTDLLGYGQYFESVGDYDAAMAVYKSIGLLGQQVMQGANYSNEYLAGLDTQVTAIEAMSALADIMDIPGGLQTIQDTYDVFVESLNIFLEYTHLLDTVTNISDINTVLTAVNDILQTGDIRYLQSLIK